MCDFKQLNNGLAGGMQQMAKRGDRATIDGREYISDGAADEQSPEDWKKPPAVYRPNPANPGGPKEFWLPYIDKSQLIS